jgi:hypothetical protein
LDAPRSKTITKGYIAIFVCLVTNVVHIEVVTSLTTQAFPPALKRFIARRGKPRTIYSDNGTNLQDASKQLHEVYKMLQSSSEMAQKDVTGNSSHHMDRTSEDYGKQRLNP